MSSLVESLSAFLFDLSFEDLSSDVIDKAKQCVLDMVGNMVYGRETDIGHKVLDYTTHYEISNNNAASVLKATNLSSDMAILAHATMGRTSDLDDGHRYAMGHPGCVLVPTALAIAEEHCRDGKETLLALVCGYEVYARLGMTINPSSYRDRGFDATGICGAVASAATVAKLMRLTQKQMADAMGLAALFCGGLIEYQNDGSMGKALCGSLAALTGVRAARLAKVGFSGPVLAFEGKKAFSQAFSNAPCTEGMLDKLGEKFHIMDVYFKKHACMRGLHSAVDAIISMREEALFFEDVEQIIVDTTPFVARLSNPAPTTNVGAQCSLEFVMSVALKYGHLQDEHLLMNCLNDKEILDKAQKVVVRISNDLVQFVDKNPSMWSSVRVSAKTMQGAVYTREVNLPEGEPEKPMDWLSLEDKYKRLSLNTLPESEAKSLLYRIRNLEKEDNLSGFWSVGNEG